MEIKILATIKFTEPLTTSNAGLSFLLILFDGRSGILNCFSIKLLIESGKIFVIKSEEFEPALTNDLDKKLGLNLSSVSPCSDKSIDVLTTRCAFLENHNVSTIIIPAANKR